MAPPKAKLLTSSQEVLNLYTLQDPLEAEGHKVQPFAVTLQERASSNDDSGSWLMTKCEDSSAYSIGHLVPITTTVDSELISKWRLQLWLVPSSNSNPLSTFESKSHYEAISCTTRKVKEQINASILSSDLQPSKVEVSVAACPRKFVKAVTEGMGVTNPYYNSECGLYVLRRGEATGSHIETAWEAEGYSFRKLCPSDAEIVDSKWEYRSDTSKKMVLTMIESDSCISLGVQAKDGKLCAWILQYQDGPLGMLFCLQRFRKKGFAKALVQRAVREIFATDQRQLSFAYIVDSNEASRNLFTGLGWRRESDADWFGLSW